MQGSPCWPRRGLTRITDSVQWTWYSTSACRHVSPTRDVLMFAPSLQWVSAVPVPHLPWYYGVVRLLLARPGGLWSPLTARYRRCRRRRRGLPRSWGIPLRACPGLGTPAVRREPRLAVLAMQPSVESTTSASATWKDFGAEIHAARSLAVYASPRQLPGAGARLATGLPATALTGLDLHQLDSVKRFHGLITAPPLPRLRGAIAWISTDHQSPNCPYHA